MGTGRTDEFRKDAVRIALTSGLSRRQVAGFGNSRTSVNGRVKVSQRAAQNVATLGLG